MGEKDMEGNDEKTSIFFEDLQREKEEKFVNLISEIIVSATLNEYYEKSDKISKIQSTRSE
ncbi:hypothetical protein [Sphingobacterium bovistauri]|uniref:Uncharacterized protein n=1 Tax=Sphingobacterium bovistauri TaxID=2781959 RepID=A0ABS7Z5Y3_9SPHI|nr:hypothetical protein [Sphingobacterium bovistauri]MCA5004962.1 hypothetical protein [Sphingobacterium bovistauri]